MPSPWPIEVLALTRATCGAVLWRARGQARATLIVKGTFTLVHEASAQITAPFEIILADRPRDGKSSLVEACEAAPHLPEAEVLLRGHAAAPAGQSVSEREVRLALFREGHWLLDKRLRIFGDRTREAPIPRLFERIPLVYERAWRGPHRDANPIGAGEGPALPNVIDPAHPTLPASFGPIPRQWMPRLHILGSRPEPTLFAPELDGAFDFRYFHAAPPDQWLPYLHGDEWIFLEGMHPHLPELRSSLPGARGVARLYRLDAPAGDHGRVVEIVADTLTIDADRLICSVVWRGSVPLRPGDTPDRLLVLGGVELPGQPVIWPPVDALRGSEPASVNLEAASRRERLQGPEDETMQIDLAAVQLPATVRQLLSTPQAASAPQPPPSAPALASAPLPPPSAPFSDTAPLPTLRVAPPRPPLEDMTLRLTAVAAPAPSSALPFVTAKPSPPPDVTPPLSPRSPASPPVASPAAMPARPAPPALVAPADGPWLHNETMRLVLTAKAAEPALPFVPGQATASTSTTAPTSFTPSTESPTLPPAAVPFALPFAPPEAGRPPTEPPAPPALVRMPFLSLDESPSDTQKVPEAQNVPDAQPAPEAPKAPDAEPIAQRSELTTPPPGSTPPEATTTASASPTEAAPATGGSEPPREAPAGGDGKGLRATLIARLASGASLGDLDLAGAALDGVNFADAALDRRSFAGASLAGCTFARASLIGVDLSSADLTDAIFTEADLSSADLSRATLARADLSRAKLARATLASAKGAGARFEGATLREADLRQARLVGAIFDGADLSFAILNKADLSRASFAKATLEGANLRAAKLKEVRLTAARLDGADLRDADLTSAHVRSAVLSGAKTSGAILRDIIEPENDEGASP